MLKKFLPKLAEQRKFLGTCVLYHYTIANADGIEKKKAGRMRACYQLSDRPAKTDRLVR